MLDKKLSALISAAMALREGAKPDFGEISFAMNFTQTAPSRKANQRSDSETEQRKMMISQKA
jgi:hypothetical protein